MPENMTRRAFVAGSTLGALGVTAAGAGDAAATDKEVRLEYLRPRQIDDAKQRCPALFQPLGTIEWHGYHNNVGVDALKAHRLCVLAARRGGGLVAPPVYGGVGGLSEPHTFVMEREDDLFSLMLRPWVEVLCREAVQREGFRAVIIVTGHYGAAQQIVVRELAVRMTRVLGVPVLGTPEYFLALDEGYTGDHAAWGETSLMLHLYPGSVDLSELGEPPHRGVGGRDPKAHATVEDGKRLTETIVERLAHLARDMPSWDAQTVQGFADAEAALVARQMTLAAQKKTIWTAWRNIGKGAFKSYGTLLVEKRFDEIASLVKTL